MITRPLAYLQQYFAKETFKENGITLTEAEYDELVAKELQSPLIQNEIHGLINKHADKAINSAKTLEELAYYRGAIDVLLTFLKKAEYTEKKV